MADYVARFTMGAVRGSDTNSPKYESPGKRTQSKDGSDKSVLYDRQ